MFNFPATTMFEHLINLHHDIMALMVGILVFTSLILIEIVNLFMLELEEYSNTWNNRRWINFTHHEQLERIWTVIPIVFLLAIAVPSFSLLYMIDTVIETAVTIKIIGHQWYWSYEIFIKDDKLINYDSYMLAEEDLPTGALRLLEVDKRSLLCPHFPVRLLITATDVTHCFAVPSLGIKIDACPGRLNQITLTVNRLGTFYGQCSEICGINHGFMPIVVESIWFQ